jgi:hypothetical protein
MCATFCSAYLDVHHKQAHVHSLNVLEQEDNTLPAKDNHKAANRGFLWLLLADQTSGSHQPLNIHYCL